MKKIKSIAVYCGSSNNVPEHFKETAQQVGELLAGHNIELVYGGGSQGLMGIVATSCLKAGGQVYGVIPGFLDNREGAYAGLTELHYVDSMHERKEMMYQRADAFVILPGGLGTLDELFEILTWKQVGLHNKLIIIMDVKRYWSALFVDFYDHLVKNGFVRAEDKNLFTLVERVEDLTSFFNNEVTNQADYVSKWG